MIDAKSFATQQARAALIEATLQQLDDDRGQPAYVLTKSHITRQLRSLEEVSVWIDRLDPPCHAESRGVTHATHGMEGSKL
ncbi:hypothetical protein H6CHR_03210 [Variovorax sp. PBL-H6]|uniref:hypothetical protein n=1 Tax=Variovorax sp. PBL-H6 TaxID=434009 RepID=UPI0013176343|nr:hypothetical protein [Variovorax sp. PBL-H6]VTU29513.1 hypothetical protein H6CHR_03210 [Variovorax sp. PBL-H6]